MGRWSTIASTLMACRRTWGIAATVVRRATARLGVLAAPPRWPPPNPLHLSRQTPALLRRRSRRHHRRRRGTPHRTAAQPATSASTFHHRLAPRGKSRVPPETRELLDRYAGEHGGVRDVLARQRDTADLVTTRPDAAECVPALRDMHRRLVDEVLPHEAAEDRQLYPALADPLGSDEATSTMSRGHVEISRLVDRIGGHLAQHPDGRLRRDEVPDLLAALYGLDAVLGLHLAQDEEDYFSLNPRRVVTRSCTIRTRQCLYAWFGLVVCLPFGAAVGDQS
ncbi:hemerythrin domain-containing protein, partial [Micromonospora sp. ATA51]|uniref:hemerythrin domain-containing protein n=1 Tax=Micromonospora sp. ATA51 TaxID=2806098 RepID=UPI002815C4C2